MRKSERCISPTREGLSWLPLFLPLLLFIRTPAYAQSDNELVFPVALMVENDVEIKSRLTGIIEKIFADRGSWVKKGEPLVQLDNADLALEVRKAEVAVEEAKAEYERAKSLFEEELLSASEYDARRLAYESRVADLEIARVDYEKSIIRAPFSGVVVERYARLGQRVVEDENVSLFRITALEPLIARIFITEEQMPRVSLGMKSVFVPNLWPDRKFNGRVKWISSAIDAASGTASAIVELNSGEGRGLLKPGTSGKVILMEKTGGKSSP